MTYMTFIIVGILIVLLGFLYGLYNMSTPMQSGSISIGGQLFAMGLMAIGSVVSTVSILFGIATYIHLSMYIL